MDFEFAVIDRRNGTQMFRSDSLSDCIRVALQHAHVEVVDRFGQVWGMN